MANKLQIKRTTISGRTPNTTNSGNTHFIDTGELALNLTDGKLFSSNGTVSFEVGANLVNASVTNILTTKAISANGSNGTAGQVLTTNGTSTYWSTVSGGGGFTNGSSISVADLEITGSLTANGSTGTSGQILASNGTAVYWTAQATGSGSFISRTYTGDGACTDFTITSGLTNNSVLVMENGIVQVPATDYSVSGSTLTFSVAPANTVGIQIRELAAYATLDSSNSYTVNNLTTVSTITVGNSTVNSVINSTSISVNLLYGNGVNITSVDAATVGGNSASDLRTYSDTMAADAYTNAIAYSSNADNLSSGTVSPARLPQANTTSNGAVVILDSVTNTAISVYAASANSVKTAYDAAINANTAAGSAYTNATSYADSKASDAYTNAITYSSDATNISSGTLSNDRLPGTIGLSTILYVGNSTVNTAITPTSVDLDGTLNVTGVSTFSNTIEMSNNIIANVADPVDPKDAVNKQYVDAIAEGLHVHASCEAATPDTLATLSGDTVTYDNGTSGVGATLTLSSAISTLDGYTLQNGDRILVKNEANTAHNGIYTRTSSTVLTRSTDTDTANEMSGGDFTFVTNGTLYNNTGWVQSEPVNTIGSDAVIYVQFSGAGTYTAGNYLYLSGSQFNVNGSSVATASVLVARDSSGNFDANTANVNAINVGANVTLSTSAISIGNSTVNTTADSTLVTTNSIKLSGGSASFATIAPVSLTSNTTVTIPDETFTIGFRNIPPVGTKTSSYTLAANDVGKYVQVGAGGSIEIPDATFAEGDAINIFNNTSGDITITCSITTAYIAGTDSDVASVTLATRGMATILFISSTVCVIAGNIT